MKKYDQILDALKTLIVENKGSACSVSDIAQQAGIGKGSIYYYFKSKDEILNALVERTYDGIIKNCKKTIEESQFSALPKIELLMKSYLSNGIEDSINRYLHDPHNADIHQKSLAKILMALTPILAAIIEQGIEENTFQCTYPMAFSELILSEFCFVFDYGLFTWTLEERITKLHAVAEVMERSLVVPAGSFSFLINPSLFDIYAR